MNDNMEETNGSRSLHETFKDLIDLQVDYNVSDISTQYLPIAKIINIGNYLAYEGGHAIYLDSDLHKYYCNTYEQDKSAQLFHIVLSVKVSNKSTLVPFSSIYDNTDTTGTRDQLFEKGQKDISLDFSTFLSRTIRSLNNDMEAPCCSFKVEKDDKVGFKITEFRLLSKFPDTNWLGILFPSDKDDISIVEPCKDVITYKSSEEAQIKTLNEILFDENKKDSFAQVFSNYYINNSQKKINSLWYTFYNMDYDFRQSAYLTRLMIISIDPYEVPEFLLRQLNKIREIASVIRSRFIFDLMEKNQHEAIKSAKAAIMSRNMSHNLGSHVMFYIKQRLQSVQKIVDTGALKYLVNANSLEELKKCISIGESEMPFLVGLGRFINYLQERQDYIATIATDYIPYKSAINFKDAIYDELKPELRFQRHYTKETKDTSMEGKQAANLLLDYIACSEGFKKSDQIELFFEDFDGTGSPSDVPHKLRQFNIALPGGNLGRQAFFSIMENIIRNTAKHDGTNLPIGNKLRFRFDLLGVSDFFKLYAWTNEKVYSTEVDSIIKTYKNHSNDFYYLGITVDIDKEVETDTLNKIKTGLCKEYLDDDVRMNEDCKGIKEIRISAAWMRGYGIDTDIPNSEPPAVAISNNNNRLQYIICLPKPKKIAIFGNKSTQLDENGIQFFKPEGINNENYGLLADFEMIVCSKDDADKLISSVGSRILIVDDVENDDDIKSTVKADNIYMRWLHEKFGHDLPKLIINDDKSYNYKHFKESDTKHVDIDLVNDGLVKCDSADSKSNQIVYSKHYEGQEEISKYYKEAPFLEGVSGGNSTDRLIRQEHWTKEWYVKQMTAGLTKIAIFDERIHSSFVKQGKNTSFADWNVEKLRTWLTNIGEGKEINSGVIQDNLNKEFKGLVNYKDIGEEDDDLNFTVKTDIETLNKVINKLHLFVSDVDYSSATLFAQKGITTFDIVSKNETIIIKGYSKKHNKDVDVAEIRLNKDSKVECIIREAEFLKKFHFVVIHQGILDKIYETLGIKSMDENYSIEKKKEVTSELFDKFSLVGERTTDGFLPQFIIHSGRSRPTAKDMPQKQPFIQFAALDHAIRDCKYTLTELLYSAHYE